MGARERPVTAAEFKRALRLLGFAPRPRNGGSHEQWVRGSGRAFRRVTVDAHHAPYHRRMLALMLRQAGLSRAEFFAVLDGGR